MKKSWKSMENNENPLKNLWLRCPGGWHSGSLHHGTWPSPLLEPVKGLRGSCYKETGHTRCFRNRCPTGSIKAGLFPTGVGSTLEGLEGLPRLQVTMKVH